MCTLADTLGTSRSLNQTHFDTLFVPGNITLRSAFVKVATFCARSYSFFGGVFRSG